MKRAHVICCNDMLMHLVIGEELTSEDARVTDKIEQLAQADYERAGKWASNGSGTRTYREYRRQLYWHTHEVTVTEL